MRAFFRRRAEEWRACGFTVRWVAALALLWGFLKALETVLV